MATVTYHQGNTVMDIGAYPGVWVRSSKLFFCVATSSFSKCQPCLIPTCSNSLACLICPMQVPVLLVLRLCGCPVTVLCILLL